MTKPGCFLYGSYEPGQLLRQHGMSGGHGADSPAQHPSRGPYGPGCVALPAHRLPARLVSGTLYQCFTPSRYWSISLVHCSAVSSCVIPLVTSPCLCPTQHYTAILHVEKMKKSEAQHYNVLQYRKDGRFFWETSQVPASILGIFGCRIEPVV